MTEGPVIVQMIADQASAKALGHGSSERSGSAQKAAKRGADVAFTNQNGWRFEMRIGRGDEGTWKASLAEDAISGRAFSPFGEGK